MDQSYLRFAEALAILGSTLEEICQRTTRRGPQVEQAIVHVQQLVEFANALSRYAPSSNLPQSKRSLLQAATTTLEDARSGLVAPYRPNQAQLLKAVVTVNSALTNVLPGIPDLPDLPKPTIPPEEIVNLADDDQDG